MFEAYSVAVRLKLVDSVSSGLIAMSSRFAAMNRQVSGTASNLRNLEERMRSIKTLGLLGGAAFGAGMAGLFAFRAPLDEAAKWQQEAAKFASLGFGDKVDADAERFARGMKTYGTSARENLALLGDAMAVFKNMGHAEFAAPLLARMKFANEAVFGQETGSSNERQFMDMLKVIELRRGLSSEAEFRMQADFVQKAISGSRGRVNASQWLQLLKTGGVGVSQMGNEAFFLGLEPLAYEFGGSRLGTSLMSVYQNLVQARASLTAQRELFRLGLLDPHKVQFNSLGQLKKAMPGSFQGSNVFEREGPLALLEKVLIPAFTKKGITSESQIIDELGLLLSNRTAAVLLSRAYQQRASIHNQSEKNRDAMGIDALYNRAKETPQGKWIELTAKYRDLMLELGTAVLPIAVKMVGGLTMMIKGAIGFAREFPTLTKGIVIAGAALAAIVTAGGAITLATAGFKALGLALAVSKGVGLGAQLLQVAGGMTAVGNNLGFLAGKLSLLGTAAAAGYAFGSAINEAGPNGDLGGWLQGKMGDWWHRNDQKYDVFHIANGHAMRASRAEADAAVTAPPGAQDISPYIALPQKNDFHFTLPVYIDGKKVAEPALRMLNKSVGGPQTGITGFDGSMQLSPAGGVGGY